MNYTIRHSSWREEKKKENDCESVNGFLGSRSPATVSVEWNVCASTSLPSHHRQLNLEYFIIEKRNP